MIQKKTLQVIGTRFPLFSWITSASGPYGVHLWLPDIEKSPVVCPWQCILVFPSLENLEFPSFRVPWKVHPYSNIVQWLFWLEVVHNLVIWSASFIELYTTLVELFLLKVVVIFIFTCSNKGISCDRWINWLISKRMLAFNVGNVALGCSLKMIFVNSSCNDVKKLCP